MKDITKRRKLLKYLQKNNVVLGKSLSEQGLFWQVIGNASFEYDNTNLTASFCGRSYKIK